MIIFVKKWNAVLAIVTVFAVVLSAGLALRPNARETAAQDGVRLVVVDAGHGEPDGGAVGQKGVPEQAVNLNIARFLQTELEKNGVQVVMTRESENGIYDEGLSTVRTKKRSDLHNREKLMNSAGADLFVSIHLNKFTEEKYSGPQVFYSPNGETSARVATCVQNAMNSRLAPPSPRDIKQGGGDIYLLKQAKIPAVLVECGFLSNAREETLLLTEAYQKQVAQAICQGVVQYFAES